MDQKTSSRRGRADSSLASLLIKTLYTTLILSIISAKTVKWEMMKVLIIEDKHKVANAANRGLLQESYSVDICYDAEEGINAIKSHSYDVAIIDAELSGDLEGVAVIRKIREQKNHTPVLMLVDGAIAKAKTEGMDAGADDYLIKPFAFEELLAKLRYLVRGQGNNDSLTLTYNDLVLNPLAYEVRRQDHPIKLSNREFNLLEYMMRNPERILTKENIISHVWDYDADVLPNTVEVYIRYLRNKIDRPFEGPQLIHTVRGFGYKLDKKGQ